MTMLINSKIELQRQETGSVVRSNRINEFHKMFQVPRFKVCYLSNKEE